MHIDIELTGTVKTQRGFISSYLIIANEVSVLEKCKCNIKIRYV